METIFVVCAEQASIDQGTNRLSLFNIVEEVSGAGFPGLVANIAFVIMLTRKNNEPENIALQIVGTLGGKELFQIPFQSSFQGKTRVRAIANLQGVPILGPGTLILSAMHKKRNIGSWSIPIVNVSPPQIAAPSTQSDAASAVTPKRKAVAAPARKRARRKK